MRAGDALVADAAVAASREAQVRVGRRGSGICLSSRDIEEDECYERLFSQFFFFFHMHDFSLDTDCDGHRLFFSSPPSIGCPRFS